MQQVTLYHFNDLSMDLQEKIREKTLNILVEEKTREAFDVLTEEQNSHLSDIEHEQFFGCTRYYAEVTPWFVPACFYEQHREDIDLLVDKVLSEQLFTPSGQEVFT